MIAASKIKENYDLAVEAYKKRHKSKHWEVYDQKFDRVLKSSDDSLESFRSNGLTTFIDFWLTDSYFIKHPGIQKIEHPEIVSQYTKDMTELEKKTGFDFIEKYVDSDLGRPAYFEFKNLKINLAERDNLYAAFRISQSLRLSSKQPVIVDIGAGYGGLIAKLGKLYPNSKLMTFDLPEANVLQTYYLSRNFPDRKVFTVTDLFQKGLKAFFEEDYGIAALPGWFIDQIPTDSIDLFVNTRSMQEMNKSQVDSYVQTIQEKAKVDSFFYCVNRYHKWFGKESVKIKEFAFDSKWQILLSETVWRSNCIHELLLKRTEQSSATSLQEQLSHLPPHGFAEAFESLLQALSYLKAAIWGENPKIQQPPIRRVFRFIEMLPGRVWRKILRRRNQS